MAIKVKILGCGEAFDARYANTSMLVEAGGRTLLFDCGYSLPPRLWSELPDPNAVDLIYISHPHADHYFGMPAALGRMWEDGRTKPLIIVSQPQVLEQIRQIMDLGYPGLSARFQYPIEYMAVKPATPLQWQGLSFDFAPTRHSVSNLAIRVDDGSSVFCYSGDGMFTDESERLMSGAALVVHEAYLFEPKPIHADIPALVEMAVRQKIQQLALIHVQRDLRASPNEILQLMADETRFRLMMPEPGDVLET